MCRSSRIRVWHDAFVSPAITGDNIALCSICSPRCRIIDGQCSLLADVSFGCCRSDGRQNRGLRGRRAVTIAGREKSVENATCATERFAQVDIPTDSGTAICTGRFSDRFFAPGAAMGAAWDTLHAVLSARCPVWHPSRLMGAVCHSLQCPYLIAALAPVFDVSARNSAYTSCHFHRGKGRCDPPS